MVLHHPRRSSIFHALLRLVVEVLVVLWYSGKDAVLRIGVAQVRYRVRKLFAFRRTLRSE